MLWLEMDGGETQIIARIGEVNLEYMGPLNFLNHCATVFF